MSDHTLIWVGESARAELRFDDSEAPMMREVIQKYIDGEYVGDITFTTDEGTQVRAYMTTDMAKEYKRQMIETGMWFWLTP